MSCPTLIRVLALVFAVCAACARAPELPPPPRNLLLISIDTLRADALGVYGSTSGASPALDRYAARSVVFEQAWSPSCKTAPAHAAMLTGLPPRVNGIDNFDTDFAHELPARSVTLAETLRARGFRTAGITAGGNVKAGLGFARGFETFDDQGSTPLQTKLDGLAKWIRARAKGERWFAFFHTYRVHDPYFAPPELIARFCDPGYRGRLIGERQKLVTAIARGADLAPNEPPGARDVEVNYWRRFDEHDPADQAYLRGLYQACVADLDRQLFALLEQLEREGALDDTLVLLTSDHGEEFGEHGMQRHDQLWRESLHVPLIVHLPSDACAGQRVTAAVSLIDIVPSLLELLDVGDTSPLRLGKSWAGWLLNPELRHSRPVLSEHRSRGNGPLDLWTLRAQGQLLHQDRDGLKRCDLGSDPAERAPQQVLAPSDSGPTAVLSADCAREQAALDGVRAAYSSGSPAELDAKTIEELKALGYL
jgi:arylsulfatase A-like enzyme